MSIKLIFQRAVVLLTALALGANAQAVENARLPYHLLYNAQKSLAILRHDHTNLDMVLTMSSILPNIQPSDLRIAIHTKAGRIPVLLGPVGNFAVPLTDELLAQDPWVVVNQPKGTVRLNWQVGISAQLFDLTNKTMPYAHFMQAVQDSGAVQEQLRHLVPGTPKLKVDGLKVTFANAALKPTITIHNSSGDQTYHGDERSEVMLPLSEELLRANPLMTFSDEPKVMEIVSHPVGQ